MRSKRLAAFIGAAGLCAVTGCGGESSPPVAVCGNGVVEGDEQCDDGNAAGGDGCAGNCTTETTRTFTFDATSNGTLRTVSFPVALAPSGLETWRTGEARPAEGGGVGLTGEIPVTVRAGEVRFDPIPISGLVCVCVRAVTAPDFGPGNAGQGTIGCGANGLTGVNVDFTIDHNISDADPHCTTGRPDAVHAGVCNGVPRITRSGQGPPGSAVVSMSISIGTMPDGGTCATETETRVCTGGTRPGTACTANPDACIGGTCVPAKGADGIPCNADDPPESHGTATTVVFTTGTATATVLDADNQAGLSINGPVDCGSGGVPCGVHGAPVHCDALAANSGGGLSGTSLAGAFALLHSPSFDDSVITLVLDAK